MDDELITWLADLLESSVNISLIDEAMSLGESKGKIFITRMIAARKLAPKQIFDKYFPVLVSFDLKFIKWFVTEFHLDASLCLPLSEKLEGAIEEAALNGETSKVIWLYKYFELASKPLPHSEIVACLREVSTERYRALADFIEEEVKNHGLAV